jgi:hypothetical protein
MSLRDTRVAELIGPAFNAVLASTSNAHNDDIARLFMLQTQFEALSTDADTWVLIDIGPNPQNNVTCQRFRFPPKIRIPCKAAVLRASGFEAFERLLRDEKYQVRLARRLRQGGEILPPGIKYLLNLGPSDDEDDRMQHLQALSLPDGIVRWYMSGLEADQITRRSCSPRMVLGHDDACSCWNDPEQRLLGQETFPTPKRLNDSLWEREISSTYRRLPDYCEVRHAANVLRLLHLMNGGSILLDSAPRVYTIAGLAKIFEIGETGYLATRLRADVCSWFLDHNNEQIIEMLPEESLQIAWNLRIPITTIHAVRQVVAEMAVYDAGHEGARRDCLNISVYGREMGSILDEDIKTTLEHCSQALVDRTLRDLGALRHKSVFDFLGVSEWQLLCRRVAHFERHWPNGDPWGIAVAGNNFKEILVQWFTRNVMDAATETPRQSIQDPIDDSIRRSVRVVHRNLTFAGYFARMTTEQKALTGIFWRQLTSWDMPHNLASSPKGYRDVENAAGLFAAAWNSAATTFTPNSYVGLARERQLPDELEFTLMRDWSELGFQHAAFEPDLFWGQAKKGLRVLADPKADQNYFKLEPMCPVTLSDHLLLSLEQTELCFLPLWAGGHDDGTGGVFQAHVPDAVLGPTGPGPVYHSGYTIASGMGSVTGTDLERLNVADDASTVVGSRVVDDSASATSYGAPIRTPVHSITSGPSANNEQAALWEVLRQSRAEKLIADYEREQQNYTINGLLDLEQPDTGSVDFTAGDDPISSTGKENDRPEHLNQLGGSLGQSSVSMPIRLRHGTEALGPTKQDDDILSVSSTSTAMTPVFSEDEMSI